MALIRRALYDGRKSGCDFLIHLRKCMDHLGFQNFPADPNVRLGPKYKSNGDQYCQYALLYSDNCIVIGIDAEKVVREEIES